ncbi:hypothetical protein ACS0TY_007669 [Phlomoides rotata]
MAELCLMASHGYPPGAGVGFSTEHASTKDFSHFLPCNGSNHDLVNPLSFNLTLHQKDEWRSSGGLLDSNKFLMVDSMSKRPAVIGFQDTSPDSAFFSFGIVERLARHEKILKLLASGSIEEDDPLVDLSMLYSLMGPQSPIADLPPQPFVSSFRQCFDDVQTLQNLVYPTKELYVKESFLELVGDRSNYPERAFHPDSCTGTEMSDILSAISEFRSSKNTNKSSRQTLLVPFFERRRRASTKTNASKLATEKVLKSKEKTSQKKKTNGRSSKERDAYGNSYLYACESLLSIIFNRKLQGENTILSLKKSGAQLPQLLTQFSASIAGTGVAVVLSVLCRVAWTQVPFCTSKLLSTGLGLGLVWLSWAISRLRDTVVSMSKCSGELGEKEEEMMNHLDRNFKDIYFRAMALMAVMVLKVA